jgi:hypothetical protein
LTSQLHEIDPSKLRRRTAFPAYFHSFLHHYAATITDNHDSQDSPSLITDCDTKIQRIYHDFDKISVLLGFHEKNPSEDMILEAKRELDKPVMRKSLSNVSLWYLLWLRGTLLYL